MANGQELLALAELHKICGKHRQPISKIRHFLNKYSDNLTGQLVRSGYAAANSNSFILTKKGLQEAQQADRAIAVLKVFCSKILGLTTKETAKHLPALLANITPDLLERYCTLVGHSYSHHSIPAGLCCTQAKAHNAETVLPLSRLPVGISARVIYIHTSQRPELLKLYDLGIHPGENIRIQQLYPAYIVAAEKGRLALDSELAKFIFVQRT